MFRFLKLGVLKKGVQTRNYPEERSPPSDAFLGLPVVDMEACDHCSECVYACPVQAITLMPAEIEISADRCIFCAACADACPEAIAMGQRYELASRSWDGMKVVYRRG
jgi:formate hydrogenlyase subunit 6/NADH:ubiquinone oxidoreductase subunit I